MLTTFPRPQKGTSVPRRYSDFVWLLDCLTRRYPFRTLPALPPKRLQLSGHYLAIDELFLDRRRRGLERALTALVAHPVLRHDALLAHFLSAPDDLAAYRKSSAGTVSLDEESSQRVLTPREEGSLPADVDARLASLRQRLPALVESWTRITTVADRLAHRRMNQGKEYEALHDALGRAVEVEAQGWRPKEVEQTEREVRATSGVANDVAETEGASARRSLETVVEELKRVRLSLLFTLPLALASGAHSTDGIARSLARSTARSTQACATSLVDKRRSAATTSRSCRSASRPTWARCAVSLFPSSRPFTH